MPATASRPLRLVLDTNVVVAGLLWDGSPRRLTDLAIMAQTVELYSSPVLLDELAHTLGYSKFAARIDSFGTSIAALVAQYTALVTLVAPASVPRIVANDADDDHVIAAAVAARAELIVTGDRKHLLPIGSHQGIAIVTAREVVDRLEARLKTEPGALAPGLSLQRGPLAELIADLSGRTASQQETGHLFCLGVVQRGIPHVAHKIHIDTSPQKQLDCALVSSLRCYMQQGVTVRIDISQRIDGSIRILGLVIRQVAVLGLQLLNLCFREFHGQSHPCCFIFSLIFLIAF